LLSLGGPFCCSCHEKCHSGLIPLDRQIAVVAMRERLLPAEVLAELRKLANTITPPHKRRPRRRKVRHGRKDFRTPG
jgi:hypothetical protein